MTAGSETSQEDLHDGARRPGLTAALVFAAIGAVFVGYAPQLVGDDPQAPPAFLSWPLLLALAALPPLLVFLFRRRTGLAAALLVGPAAFAPGRLAMDAQLWVDPGQAARPELLFPASLNTLTLLSQFLLLSVGHIATAVAGVLALRTRAPESEVPGFAETSTGVRRRGLVASVLGVAVVASLGLLLRQFTSDDPFLLPRAAVDSPPWVFVGSLLLAIAVPSVGCYAAVSSDPEFARGALLGLALAVAGVVVPPLVAAGVVEALHFGVGAVLGLVAALVLAGLAIPAGRSGDAASDEVRLPAMERLRTVSGVLAVAAGAFALVAVALPLLEMPPGLTDPTTYPALMLWPAGLVLGVVGAGVLLPRHADLVRPALTVVWAAIPLAVAGLIDIALTVTQAVGAHVGLGTWSAVVALFVAPAVAVTAALAGGVERDDVDLTEIAPHRPVVGLGAGAALLAVGAFALPVVAAPGFEPPGVFTDFGTASWGLAIGLAAVVVAALLAPRCRPPRAAALLVGAALVVLVRVSEYPLTSARFDASAPGLGLWAALGCLVVLLVAAFAALRAQAAPERSS